MRLRVCSNFSRSKTRIQLFLNPKPSLLNPALLMNGGINYRILDLTVDGTQSLVWSLGSLVWSQHSFLLQHLWGRDISSLGMEVYPYLCGAVSLARNSSCCLVISTWSHIDRSFNIWRLLLYFLSLLVRQAKHVQFLQSFLRLLWDHISTNSPFGLSKSLLIQGTYAADVSWRAEGNMRSVMMWTLTLSRCR